MAKTHGPYAQEYRQQMVELVGAEPVNDFETVTIAI